MVSVYEPASQSICAVDEHGAIVEALRARNMASAIDLSHHHFLHVEQRLRMGPKNDEPPALEEIFGRRRVANPAPRQSPVTTHRAYFASWKYDAERMAASRAQPADAMAQVHPIDAARALHGPVMNGKDRASP